MPSARYNTWNYLHPDSYTTEGLREKAKKIESLSGGQKPKLSKSKAMSGDYLQMSWEGVSEEEEINGCVHTYRLDYR